MTTQTNKKLTLAGPLSRPPTRLRTAHTSPITKKRVLVGLDPAIHAGPQTEAQPSKVFFFAKKKQKTFVSAVADSRDTCA